MSDYDYDYFVIGAGSAGVRSARIAAQKGAKVGIAESSALGGTCVNLGCVPKKMFAYAADVHKHIEDAKAYGWNVELASFDWQTLRNHKNRDIERLNKIYESVVENNGIDLYRGHARFIDPHTLDIDGKQVSAAKIAIATGGQPRTGGFSGAEHAIVSDQAFHLDTLPKSVVIYGGGYIAVEFAHIYFGLGLDVTLIYRGEEILRGFDTEIRTFVREGMEAKGIKILRNTEITQVTPDGSDFEVSLNDGETLKTGMVFSAIGRVPKIDDLGLENLNVGLDNKGYVVVDDNFQTTQEDVYALGDIVGKEELTPVAIRHGHHLALHLFDNDSENRVDFDLVPTAVFSDPEIGTCGYSEEQAIDKFGKVDVYTSTFRPLKYTIPQRDERTFMKLIVARESDKVVGLHIAGLDAAEIIQGFSVGLQMGATKKDFDRTVAIHPSSAEEFVTMSQPTRSHG